MSTAHTLSQREPFASGLSVLRGLRDLYPDQSRGPSPPWAREKGHLDLCSVMWPHLVSCRCPPAIDRWCTCIFLSFFHHQEWVQLTGTQWVSVSTVLSIMRSSLNAADRSSLTMTLSNRWLYWFSITSEVLSISWRSSSCHRRKKRDKRRNRQNQGKRLILDANYMGFNTCWCDGVNQTEKLFSDVLWPWMALQMLCHLCLTWIWRSVWSPSTSQSRGASQTPQMVWIRPSAGALSSEQRKSNKHIKIPSYKEKYSKTTEKHVRG